MIQCRQIPLPPVEEPPVGEAGTITILDPAFLEKGMQYFVSAGHLGVGNYEDTEKLTRLLRE